MSEHAETALDQLRLADDLAQSRTELHAGALAAAQVHAQLALAEAVLKAGLQPGGDPWPPAPADGSEAPF